MFALDLDKNGTSSISFGAYDEASWVNQIKWINTNSKMHWQVWLYKLELEAIDKEMFYKANKMISVIFHSTEKTLYIPLEIYDEIISKIK